MVLRYQTPMEVTGYKPMDLTGYRHFSVCVFARAHVCVCVWVWVWVYVLSEVFAWLRKDIGLRS